MFSFGVFSRILIKIEIECLPGSLFTPGTFLFQITCINDGLCIPLPQSSFPASLFWIHPTYKTNLCSNIFIHLRVPFDASYLIKVTDVSTVTYCAITAMIICSCFDCKRLSGLMLYLSTSPDIICISVYLLTPT